jgi:hypothetical protein
MKATVLLRLAVRSRRDLARVRLQARQMARMLGFAPLEQLEIACSAFQLALEASGRKSRSLIFELRGEQFWVREEPSETKTPPGGFTASLPRSPEFATEDIAWMTGQLNGLIEVDLLEVVKEQNEDIKRLIHALKSCRSDLERLDPAKPSAA